MLQDHPFSATLVTTDLERAKRFYTQTLGLKLKSEDQGPLFFEGPGGSSLMIYPRDDGPKSDHTQVHWWVSGLDKLVEGLSAKGVEFEKYPDMGQDERGVSRMEGRPRAAWLKDPDGNILGLMETK